MTEFSDMPVSLMVEDDANTQVNGVAILCRRKRRVIWLAVKDGRRVVLKGLPEHLRNHPEEIAALRKEYLLALRVEAVGVIRVYGYLLHPQLGPVIEMEYIDGIPLNEYLASNRKLGLVQRRRIALKIAEAIAAVHRAGIVHRDLKPDNILITSKDAQPKIIDFGNGDAEEFVLYKNSMGTQQYGAPEQQIPSQGGMASDTYSFGKILEELLPERRFLRLRKACLEYDPAKRPSMVEVERELAVYPTRPYLIKVMALAGIICVIATMVIVYVNSKEDITTYQEHPKDADINIVDSESHADSEEKTELSVADNATDKIKKTVIEDETGIEAVIRKYIVKSDEVNARYGAIEYDSVFDPELAKAKSQLRLKRGEEHYKLAGEMERELTSMGMNSQQCAEANHALWSHIIKETNRIDGADKIRNEVTKNYGLSPSATE